MTSIAGDRRRGTALRCRVGVLPAILLVALVAPAAASAAGSPVKGSVALSNERSLTRWAHAVRRAPIRARPNRRARSIVATRKRTEDGFPETYLALRSWSSPHGNDWLKVRIPMRPNGRKGWVRRSALGPIYRLQTRLVIDRGKQQATLRKRGRKIWTAPVGVGKRRTPTPRGRFNIREKFKTGDPGGSYGPMAFGTSAYSVLSDWPGGGVIGIHGTDRPALIPGRPSHGCIRVRNGDLRRLWARMPVGTPVLIR